MEKQSRLVLIFCLDKSFIKYTVLYLVLATVPRRPMYGLRLSLHIVNETTSTVQPHTKGVERGDICIQTNDTRKNIKINFVE